jgi:invasion protein IalB
MSMMDLMTNLTRRLLVLSATGMLSLVGMGVGSVLAQQAQPVQPSLAPKAAAEGSVSNGAGMDEWVKVCGVNPADKKEVCQTTYDLRASTGQFLANVGFMETTGEARKMVRLLVPTGFLLQEGMTLKVDDGKPEVAKYSYCAPDLCVGGLVMSDAFVAAMKKGKMLTVSVLSQSASPVQFQFSLATFAAANGGKPLDKEALKKRQEQLLQEVQQKQSSLEEQLKAAQQKALQGTTK